MSKHGIKACFFINPNIIGENNFEKVRVHCQTRLNFPPVEFLDWDEVEQIQNLGHEIGSHTMSHVNIGNATPEEIHSEIGNSYTIIKSKCGEAKHFAFPYGRFFHFSETGRKAVFEAGFISCATAERGCHISNDRPIVAEQLCILRDHAVLDWNIDHIFHFLANNSSHANSKNNFYPPLKL